MIELTSPRQVRFKRCTINAPGLHLRVPDPVQRELVKTTGLDLTPYVQRVEIFESIFQNTITATIVFLEDIALVEFIPIVGIESVLIEFSVEDDKGKEQEYRRIFRVTKIHDMSYPRDGWRLFTMELATHEFVQSVSSRISRVYNNKSAAEAVADIMLRDLGVTMQPDSVEKTFGTIDVTIPNYTPLQAINYFALISQTVSNPRESNFLFYETLHGFYFRSIRQLILDGRTNPLRTFRVNPGAISNDNKVNDTVVRNSLIQVHQDQSFDLLMDIASGMLRSRMVHFDFLARRVAGDPMYKKDIDTRYTDSFPKTTHLAKYPVYPVNFDESIGKNTRIFTFPSNAWSKDSSYIKSIERQQESNVFESIVLRNRQLREIQHLQTLIDTPGHPDIHAGAVIDIQYPSSISLQRADVPNTVSVHQEPTPYYSGPHLVTAVRHVIAGQASGSFEYRMHTRVCRDSLSSPLVGFTK